MEENNNVQQLSVALNQLLDAYENLQKENKELSAKLEEAENKNIQLDDKLNSLSNTTSLQSNEMGDMLNRIETILSNPLETNSQPNDIPIEHNEQEQDNKEQNNENPPQQEDSKAVDLGRMQSLLNGFNN